jgi:hypothetical protein
MPSSKTMLAHQPSQVPENCAICGKQGREGGIRLDVASHVRHDYAAGDGATQLLRGGLAEKFFPVRARCK